MIQSRTHNCNELRLSDAGKKRTIPSWMKENIRKVSKNLGFLIFRFLVVQPSCDRDRRDDAGDRQCE